MDREKLKEGLDRIDPVDTEEESDEKSTSETIPEDNHILTNEKGGMPFVPSKQVETSRKDKVKGVISSKKDKGKKIETTRKENRKDHYTQRTVVDPARDCYFNPVNQRNSFQRLSCNWIGRHQARRFDPTHTRVVPKQNRPGQPKRKVQKKKVEKKSVKLVTKWVPKASLSNTTASTSSGNTSVASDSSGNSHNSVEVNTAASNNSSGNSNTVTTEGSSMRKPIITKYSSHVIPSKDYLLKLNRLAEYNYVNEKGKLLHMIKDLTFDGKNDSNPIVHMENFVDICDLFKTEADPDDAIRLRVFPLTLIGEARAWLRSLEPSSITTWEGLRSKFLSRFFPPSKIDKLRAEIRSFQQQDGETISEAWERFKHLLNSCPSHELNKSEQVQTFYSGLAYSSRATLDSSAGGVFMYKTPTEGYKLLEDMLIHNIDWRTDKRLQIPRMAGKISTDFDPSDELAAMKNQQVKFERKIEELIKSVHALQVGCEECNGPHLTKDCPNKPMMTPEEVNYINRGDYQGRWNNNRNFIPRPPGFFAPTQQNQRSDGEPHVSIEDRIVQFMDAQKKLNDEVGSYLRNHQSTIQNLELQTDIYTKKYVETESESEPDYATDYDSEGFTVSFEHLRLKVPEASSDDDDEEDGKQGGYAEFVIPKKEDKGKEKEKAPDDDLIYIAPIKHDLGSYNLPISCHKFSGLALVDSGAALNMMPVCYCKKMGVKRIVPTNYQYRGVNGYMTTPLGIAEGVPIRIGKFVYYTDFVIANLPQNTEIPIILGRSFLHTAQVNTDMRNQVMSLGYGDNRIYFDPNGEPVRHLDEPYDDPSLAYTKSTNRLLLPHELGKKTEDYSNPMRKKEQSTKEPGTSKKDHRRT
ncbi:hypothetical protein OSB04_032091 [Centaurea solstitialis]|uniref:Retrotransposon gag domain-containing protein n=1 Tax=Centaurea solstitialis TaxID=347529 RepID=A0AA38SIA1_9ASTR|nr:hypothetical protein OSB04_032091 [Centaurea solstitialis]